MHIERIHFDEVFDTAAKRGDFSFRSGGRTRYGVHLQRGLRPGPIPRAGSSWIVAFAEPDDWSTVLGWLDEQTKTLTLTEPVWLTVLLGLGSLAWFSPFALAGALLFGGPGAALALLLVLCGFACIRLGQVMARKRQVRAALQGQASALPA